MRLLSASGFCLLFAVLSAGCRCGCLESASGDFIDSLSERRLSLEFVYKPGLDLTRIGKPDWCRSSLNQLFCRDTCCGSCGNSCRSGCCQLAAACAQSTTDCCRSACHSGLHSTKRHRESVPVLQSTWENKTVRTSASSFEELPHPDDKKEGPSALSVSSKRK